MPPLSPTEYRTIIVVDVADFTNPGRNVPHMLAVQAGLYDALKTAFADAGVDFDSCTIEDRGDGALILVPSTVSKSRLADLLPDRLLAELRRYNSTRVPEAQFKLRIALHAGDIRHTVHGWLGTAVNDAFRILEAKDAKTALAESEGLIAVIAAEYFFHEVIKQDPGTAPESYRQIDVSVKSFNKTAWLRLPGVHVLPRPRPRVEEPQPPVADDGSGVLGVIPPEELGVMREWLDGVEVPHLPILANRAGPTIPASGHKTVWGVFLHLADFNAGPDGFPPALAFLELVADEVGGAVGANVTAWVEQQARRLRRGQALEDRRTVRPPIPVRPCLHLVIAVEPDAIDTDRCVLSYWRQDDPLTWEPVRGAVREVAVDELEHCVDEVILDAERLWSDQSISAAIEFLVPRSLLHLPVHRWCKEHESGDPRPLVYDYQVSFRSLERMRAEHWRRAWRTRWELMSKDSSVDRVHPFGVMADVGLRIDAALSDAKWIGMVAEKPPFARSEPGAGPDALTAAFRAGLPLIIWHPTGGPDELHEFVSWLVGGADGFAGLLDRRKEAHTSAPLPIFGDLVRDLVVLWDDPSRLIVLDQPLIPVQQ